MKAVGAILIARAQKKHQKCCRDGPSVRPQKTKGKQKMKVENLAIIFLAILIPIILVLSYYLDLQQETLTLQAEYDTRLATATKEAIKAFEINTVDWAEWISNKTRVTERNDVKAAINTFISRMASHLNVTGTAKEYMQEHIPAVAMTMYDGYYIYAPTHVPKTIVNDKGVQLYFDEISNSITTEDGEGKNLPIYKPNGKTATISKEYEDKNISFVVDINSAETEYKHSLSSQISYTKNYKASNVDVDVNYTLDNQIYLYGFVGSDYVEKEGYLVYFDSNTEMPNIEGTTPIQETQYNGIPIQPETLEEQILYLDNGNYVLGTFKYIYDIEHQKLYYDEDQANFFTYDQTTKERHFLVENVTAGSPNCKYKSYSLLGNNTEYVKIYQVLNINKDENDNNIEYFYSAENGENGEVDKLKEFSNAATIGLDANSKFKDYSAINYYVESYAFTNWVKETLGSIDNVKVEGTEKAIFMIDKNNNPEVDTSPIVIHKKEVMKDNIISNLNLAISNYAEDSDYEYKLPVLNQSEWEQIFNNISMITFFQGVPIGFKEYNNYSIATSTTNREFVDSDEIYIVNSGYNAEDSKELDKNYHRTFCKNTSVNSGYVGYRSVEFVLREFTKEDSVTNTTTNINYYQHGNKLGCYYCVVNRANYEKAETDSKKQAYYEALGRERYYQNQRVII